MQYFGVYNLSKIITVDCVFIFGLKMSIVKLSEKIDLRKIRPDLGMSQEQFRSPYLSKSSGNENA